MVTLTIVSPKSADVRPGGSMGGYLKVYSATSEYSDGDLMYYPHSRYSICRANGTRYKWVDNHKTDNDESPERVALPTGTYYVLAQSDHGGLVKVAVVIKDGQTTVVNLEGGTQGGQSSRAGKLPGGQVIGWHASS
jgi:hypothetical protein